MRRVRYAVAASLDGYIAGPGDEADWIVMDPEIDFEAIFNQFDTVLVGRRSFEGMVQAGRPTIPGMDTLVFSTSLSQNDHPDVTIVDADAAGVIADLRTHPGKDIWLFGGGLLFRSLCELHVVDSVEVAVVPILLGGGIPLFPPPGPTTPLALTGHRVYENTGTVLLEYAMPSAAT